ncbi:MAG: Crp/Fnr family transcriptional regulator [Pseudomonadota bacterium]
MSFSKVFQLYDHAAKRLTFKKDETIYRSADAANTLYQLVHGSVALRQVSRKGNDIILTIYGRNQCFGIIEYIDAMPRICDAIALEKCTIKALERKDILTLITTPDPALNAALMSEIAKNAICFADLAITMITTNPEERVLRRLYELAYMHPNGVYLSQERLGHLTGLTRETVNKVLKRIAEQGIISVERSHIRFNNINKLQESLHDY